MYLAKSLRCWVGLQRAGGNISLGLHRFRAVLLQQTQLATPKAAFLHYSSLRTAAVWSVRPAWVGEEKVSDQLRGSPGKRPTLPIHTLLFIFHQIPHVAAGMFLGFLKSETASTEPLCLSCCLWLCLFISGTNRFDKDFKMSQRTVHRKTNIVLCSQGCVNS